MSTIKDSFKSLKKVSTITIAAMLIALDCVLRLLVIPVSSVIHIQLFFLTSAAVGMLIGPIPAAVSCALADVISYFLNPQGPYFFGFTLSAFIVGFIFGILFYGKSVRLLRIIIARAITVISCEILLSSVWLSAMYNMQFWPLLWSRVIKCVCLFPFEVALIYFLNTAIAKFTNRKKL